MLSVGIALAFASVAITPRHGCAAALAGKPKVAP